MPLALSSGALSIESKERNAIFGLFFASTFVIAAVSVVFPWSTCPIVPTFACGFLRSNFAFPIASPPMLPSRRHPFWGPLSGRRCGGICRHLWVPRGTLQLSGCARWSRSNRVAQPAGDRRAGTLRVGCLRAPPPDLDPRWGCSLRGLRRRASRAHAPCDAVRDGGGVRHDARPDALAERPLASRRGVRARRPAGAGRPRRRVRRPQHLPRELHRRVSGRTLL